MEKNEYDKIIEFAKKEIKNYKFCGCCEGDLAGIREEEERDFINSLENFIKMGGAKK